jgi:hypothetical protein
MPVNHNFVNVLSQSSERFWRAKVLKQAPISPQRESLATGPLAGSGGGFYEDCGSRWLVRLLWTIH